MTLFQQVPVLPAVIPIALAAFLVLLRSLRRRRRMTWPRVTVAAVLCVYLGGIIANTVFPIFLNRSNSGGPWSQSLNVVPVAGYELADAAMNAAVFAPLGALAPLLMTSPTWGRVLKSVAAVSLTIEVTQYVTAHTLGGGHIADVNDLLSNVLGGALGYGLLTLLERIPAVHALVRRFRWNENLPDS